MNPVTNTRNGRAVAFAGVVTTVTLLGMLLAAFDLSSGSIDPQTTALAVASAGAGAFLASWSINGHTSWLRAAFSGLLTSLLGSAVLGLILGAGTPILLPVALSTAGLLFAPVGILVSLIYFAVLRQYFKTTNEDTPPE
jgi:hypothetical protein